MMLFKLKVHKALCIFQSGSKSTVQIKEPQRTFRGEIDLSPLFTRLHRFKGHLHGQYLDSFCLGKQDIGRAILAAKMLFIATKFHSFTQQKLTQRTGKAILIARSRAGI